MEMEKISANESPSISWNYTWIETILCLIVTEKFAADLPSYSADICHIIAALLFHILFNLKCGHKEIYAADFFVCSLDYSRVLILRIKTSNHSMYFVNVGVLGLVDGSLFQWKGSE